MIWTKRALCACFVAATAFAAMAAEPATRPAGLMESRKGFKTVVRPIDMNAGRNPTPPVPPASEYTLVRYPSPAGQLDAYLSARPKDTKKHPAVIWAKGGYKGLGVFWEPESAENDQTPRAFKDAGIVVMIPAWRGQGRNPGKFEMFYGEVDDALAAIDYLAKLPYVDPSRIYMVGHSTGGTMTLLTAEASTKLRAAFSLGGCPDVQRMVTTEDDHSETPFDYNSQAEGRLRSAINFIDALQTPTWYFEGETDAERSFYPPDAMKMGRLSEKAKVPFHPFVLDGGTHFTIVRPVTQLLAQKILGDTGPTCNITITAAEISQAWGKVFPGTPLACITPAMPDITISEKAAKAYKQAVAGNNLDPASSYVVVLRQQGKALVAIEGKTPMPEPAFIRTESKGIAIGVDFRLAGQLPPSIIDLDRDPATGRPSIVLRPVQTKQ